MSEAIAMQRPVKVARGTLVRRPLAGDPTAWSFVAPDRAQALLGRYPGTLAKLISDPGLEALLGQWVYRWYPDETRAPEGVTVH